jgi:hypothetical protein
MRILMTFAAALTTLALSSYAPMVYAASGKACMDNCLARLKSAGQLNQYPRGYCREQCNYYVAAPVDVLRKSGRATDASLVCLESCRTKMRTQPGFLQNPTNSRYCKDKCGVP